MFIYIDIVSTIQVLIRFCVYIHMHIHMYTYSTYGGVRRYVDPKSMHMIAYDEWQNHSSFGIPSFFRHYDYTMIVLF